MKKRIIAAALVVIMSTGLFACENKRANNSTGTDADAASVSITESEAATTAGQTTQEQTSGMVTTQNQTTAKHTTSKAVSTAAPTVFSTAKQVVTTTKKIVTTVKNTTTSKASQTVPETVKKPTTTVVKTTKAPETEAETTERKLYDYRTEEKTYTTDLRYGVIQRKVVKSYYEKLPDGTEILAKEEVSAEVFDRVLYRADYDELLPAAKENIKKYRSKINEVLEIINGYRAAGGLKPLKLNEKLTEIANVRAEEIAWSGNHSHTRPNFKSCFSLMRDNGFETGYAGENIGWGFDSSVSVCEAWKNSETHYENIMNPTFKETGIGIAADPDKDGKLCWAQYFYEG